MAGQNSTAATQGTDSNVAILRTCPFPMGVTGGCSVLNADSQVDSEPLFKRRQPLVAERSMLETTENNQQFLT